MCGMRIWKLIAQVELWPGITVHGIEDASIYIGMHGGIGNVMMHVWHVHECVDACRHAASVQVRQVSNMMQCSVRMHACACIQASNR